jgi:hypothetical protein
MMNVMRVVLDTRHQYFKTRLLPLLLTKRPQQVESSGGPLETTLSEIDRLIADVVPEKNTEGTIAPKSSASKGKRTEEASL